MVNIPQFQISIQLPTWTHPFLWDVLRCGRPPSPVKHAKFTSSTLYAWLCMEKFYEQLACVIKMIKIKEFSGYARVTFCHNCHVSPKLAFVWCLPRLCNPKIHQLCRQKLAYYIPAAFKYLTMIIYCICDCRRNILASLSFWMLCLQHRTSSKKFLWPKNSEAKCGIPNFKWWPLPWEDLRRTSIHKRIQGERSKLPELLLLDCDRA